MRIIIEYDSSWRNSILEDFQKEPIEKRKFKATSKSKEAVDIREITNNTVLGVMCRLIGDQKKLYQSKASDDFYFRDMEITYRDTLNKKTSWNETVMLVNKSEHRPAPSQFIGELNKDESLFFSKYSYTLWSILDYDIIKLLDFITSSDISIDYGEVSPIRVLNRVRYDILAMDKIEFIENKIKSISLKLDKEMEKDKPRPKYITQFKDDIKSLNLQSQLPVNIQFERKVRNAVDVLSSQFPEQNYYDKGGNIYPMSLYSGALYLAILRLSEMGVDINELVTKNGSIKGFSKRGFNSVREFMNPLMGNKRKTTRTPYPLTKASGQLEINLDIDIKKAKELKKMIEDAGVSSFYLGKKGLAYVSNISLH